VEGERCGLWISTVPRMSDYSTLGGLNAAEPAAAEHDLLACCGSRRWADEVLARRPYPDLASLRVVSELVLRELDWVDVEQALAAHPRIGDRVGGSSTEAAWSRDEQAGATATDELTRGNLAYEARFGHVFLICATGLTGEEMLTALQARLDHEPATERDVVREELRKIVDLRLGKAFT
jgi:2-oxo-4-hydroxy-4-carboxy-5-ureidoimidazoline decarboxylase